MKASVLCVDDDEMLVAASQRFLKAEYTVATTTSGADALDILATRGPFAVVVSDLQMPDMNGITFLGLIRERYPDTVRILLTGNANLEHALQAVNDGHVFRFLSKPCPPATLRTAVGAGVAQHELILADRRRVEVALRESEERYRLLFDCSPHPKWVYDAESLRFLAVNEAAVRQYGYSRDEFLAMTVRDVAIDAGGDGRSVAFPEHGALCRHRLKSGDVRQVEVATNPIDFDARAARLALIVDVTDKKLLEDQLKQAQKLESVGQLAAGIAHEINTPIQYVGDNINFLRGAFRDFGEALARYRSAGADAAQLGAAERAAVAADIDFLLEEVPRAIEQSLDGVGHVARIVKAMKEFAHPGAEEKAPVDLNRALETVITVARNEWKYVAEVVTDLEPDLPPVSGLAGELNQVLLNLLVNAAHAVQSVRGSEGAKGTITISTRHKDGVVEVRVSDTGCGISDEHSGRVFDPFFTTKPVGQGTGQGLALAHAVVVQRHGGAISFETEVGKGTTFVVRLPVESRRLTRSEVVQAVSAIRRLPTPAAGGT